MTREKVQQAIDWARNEMDVTPEHELVIAWMVECSAAPSDYAYGLYHQHVEKFTKFARLAAAHERAKCAKLCDAIAIASRGVGGGIEAADCCKAIRGRGEGV